MKNAIEIVNLFELVRKCSDEDWKYNKERLVDILEDYAQGIKERAVIEDMVKSIPTTKEIKQILSGENPYEPATLQIDQLTLNHCAQQLYKYYQLIFEKIPEEKEAD